MLRLLLKHFIFVKDIKVLGSGSGHWPLFMREFDFLRIHKGMVCVMILNF